MVIILANNNKIFKDLGSERLNVIKWWSVALMPSGPCLKVSGYVMLMSLSRLLQETVWCAGVRGEGCGEECRQATEAGSESVFGLYSNLGATHNLGRIAPTLICSQSY